MPYANSLDPDETPNNLASHPDPSYLTLRQYFYQLSVTLKHFECCSRRQIKQTNKIFGRLRVKRWKKWRIMWRCGCAGEGYVTHSLSCFSARPSVRAAALKMPSLRASLWSLLSRASWAWRSRSRLWSSPASCSWRSNSSLSCSHKVKVLCDLDPNRMYIWAVADKSTAPKGCMQNIIKLCYIDILKNGH